MRSEQFISLIFSVWNFMHQTHRKRVVNRKDLVLFCDSTIYFVLLCSVLFCSVWVCLQSEITDGRFSPSNMIRKQGYFISVISFNGQVCVLQSVLCVYFALSPVDWAIWTYRCFLKNSEKVSTTFLPFLAFNFNLSSFPVADGVSVQYLL